MFNACLYINPVQLGWAGKNHLVTESSMRENQWSYLDMSIPEQKITTTKNPSTLVTHQRDAQACSALESSVRTPKLPISLYNG